jgi:tetrahydromethanopterin S-methyltransferase subunit G
MRTVGTNKGFSIIVSNEEYRLLKKVDANIEVKVDYFGEYYQELGEKLVSRGVLNKVDKDGTEYFVSIKRSKQ